jgi:hypothetical protein
VSEKKPLIAICTPSRGIVNTTWAQHLIGFRPPPGVGMTILNESEYDVAVARQKLVNNARAIGASHIFFLDDDLFIPHDAIARLYGHKVPFVSGVYSVKNVAGPIVSTEAFVDIDGVLYQLQAKHMAEDRLICDPRVSVGLGCSLIHMSVFDKLRPPFFKYGWSSPDMSGLHYEDLHFCGQCRMAGFTVHMDTSVRCVHSGTYMVRWDGEAQYLHPGALYEWLERDPNNRPEDPSPPMEKLRSAVEDVVLESRSLAGHPPASPTPAQAKVGRNRPCPCGSGEKYKKCCGTNA